MQSKIRELSLTELKSTTGGITGAMMLVAAPSTFKPVVPVLR